MAVNNYAQEHVIRIKDAEKRYDSNDESDNGESEDHFPLIRQPTKILPFGVNIYRSKRRNLLMYQRDKRRRGETKFLDLALIGDGARDIGKMKHLKVDYSSGSERYLPGSKDERSVRVLFTFLCIVIFTRLHLE